MNILRVISTMDPKAGGPCQGIRNAVPALKALGVDNEVVCLDAQDADYLGTDDFTIHALGAAKGPWAYHKALIPWLVKHASQYDAIIIHGLWQYNSYAVYKAIKQLAPKSQKPKAKTQQPAPSTQYPVPSTQNPLPSTQHPKPTTQHPVPYYVMPHGMLDPYFQNAPDRRLKALRNRLFWKLIEGKVVNNANGVLFTCQEELLLARNTFMPYHPKYELNVGYGILEPLEETPEVLKAFHAVCPDLKGAPFLLFLSRIHPKKGVDILLKAYKEWLLSPETKKPLKLVIAGPGLETDYGQELQAFTNSQTMLKDHVYFTGMLKGEAKWGAYYACEAFVLSSHQENFGISIVEALACGTPVLISNKVNIWREIAGEHAGFVEDDTPLGTLKLLKNWDRLNPEEQKEMRKKARMAYETLYAMGPVAQRFKDIIINKSYL